MTTPSKSEIIAKARELWHEQEARNGNPAFDIDPELSELREQGLLAVAQSELMYADSVKYELDKWERYAKQTEQPKENFAEKQTVSEIPFNIRESCDTGFFIAGTSQSGKTTLAKHLVQKLIQRGICVYVLDVSRAWMHDTPINNFITVPHGETSIDVPFGKSVVFDLSELSYDERFQFVSVFTASIYDVHKRFGYKTAPQAFIVYEESQTYLPNGCYRSTKKYSAMIDLTTVGANFNLRFGLITQFPASIDKAPVKISQQRYFGWTTEKNDIDYIRKFIGKDWIPEIKTLQKGEFLYQCRNEITKFQCGEFGTVKGVSNGYSYEMQFPLVVS